jgi:hypothetical protein
MSENVVLIEKSFADAIAMIAAAEELPEEKRRHWATSLRQVAKALDRPLEVIPARYSAVRADLINLHEVPAGLTAKTLQNHKSNTKSALLYLARERGVPEYGAPLMEEWQALKAKIEGSLVRHRLSSLMRFCSANGIKPGEVTESVVERFIDYRSRCGKPADTAFQRLMARAWNANVGMIPGWPDVTLVEPPVKSTVEIAWSDFPEGLRREVDSYLEGLTKIRRNRKGHRVRPLKAVTLRTRRAELQGAARMAVKAGVPVENLNSLAALLAPEVAEQVLEAYCTKNGEKPKLYTIDLAGRFLSIARETKCLNEDARGPGRGKAGRFYREERHSHQANSCPQYLGPRRQSATPDDGRGPPRPRPCAGPISGQGADRGGDCAPDHCPRSHQEPDRNTAWSQPQQARRARIGLLAEFPGL